MSKGSVAIVCTSCGAETFVRREPLYEGFKKTGERLLCASCGVEFASEADVPYVTDQRPELFSDADRNARVDVFKSDERGRNCRHCRHYVVNPFTQRCGLHDRVVEATDLCADFERDANEE
jgi:hypothetical protein